MITIAMAGQALMLAGISRLLESTGTCKIDIRAISGKDLITQLHKTTVLPDICIIGAKPEGIDGYNTMQKLSAQWPGLKTMVLTSLNSPVALMLMMHYGAQGFTSLSCREEVLMENIAIVCDGYSCYPYELSRQLNAMLKTRKRRQGICIFSQKELDVMHLLCRQYAIKQIACQLNVSECTINIHLKHIYDKLTISNKHELMSCLHEAGFDISKDNNTPPSGTTTIPVSHR